jgi:hypothetical protein
MPVRSAVSFLPLLLLAIPAAPQLALAAQKAPAGAKSALSPQDLSSPEGAVRSFVNAINRLDVEGAKCLVGGKVDADLKTWAQGARSSPEKLRITVVEITPQITGDAAKANVTLDLLSGKEQQRFEETLSLRRVGGEWKIVPPTEAELEGYSRAGEKNPHVLATLAVIYTHPAKMLARQRGLANHTVCTSHVKQLAVGLLMFLQDNDDRFPTKADSYKAVVMAYVRDRDVFNCPSTGKATVAYSLNTQLQGKLLGSIRKPELTVMIYEGKQGKLEFRHDGRATVALANGRVQRVTPAEARAFRWAP